MRLDDGVLVSNPKNTKDMERAQAAFHKKEQQQREGAVAMAEYRAANQAERDKTEKLRALRLAKEAAEAKAKAEAPPAPAKKKATVKKRR